MRYRNKLRTLAAGVVAGVAAIASYSHMRDLAAEHGQPEYLARLLPISVDGLLVVASVVMTEDREAGRPARGWSRVSFVIGVVASVAANIAAAPEDAISRIISAWPAVALLLVVEMLIGKREVTTVDSGGQAAEPAQAPPVVRPANPDPGTVGSTRDVATPVAEPVAVKPLVAVVPQDAGTVPAIRFGNLPNADRVRLVAGRLPHTASLAEIAAAAGCSERTAGRYLPDDHPAKPGKGKTPEPTGADPVPVGAST